MVLRSRHPSATGVSGLGRVDAWARVASGYSLRLGRNPQASSVRPSVRIRPRLCPWPPTGRPPDHPSVDRRQVSSRTRGTAGVRALLPEKASIRRGAVGDTCGSRPDFDICLFCSGDEGPKSESANDTAAGPPRSASEWSGTPPPRLTRPRVGDEQRGRKGRRRP